CGSPTAADRSRGPGPDKRLAAGRLAPPGTALLLHRIELPLPWHALQRVHATVRELDSRPGNEVRDRARDEHLTRTGNRSHTGADVDGNAAEIVADEFALAGMEAGAHLDAKPAHGIT